ncbi:MAG: glutamyl-tRNA reductase [Actinomycetota bacterium]|nr:MAG: glutamyl-tRNA reductase [Actinomycetota bacterium]
MTVLAVGLSHRSAPVEVLDRAAVLPADIAAVLQEVIQREHVAEAMVVATCNRVEVYADVARFHPAVEDVTAVLAKSSGLHRDELVPHLYVHYDEAAVSHLFEVASGLDSMVVGEQQILGQVRAALRTAQSAGTAARVLNDLGQHALRVGKRVHAETRIDRAGASVVSVALAAAADRLGSLAGRRAVVVGAGAMSSLAAAALHRAGVGDLAVVNRTPESAVRLGLAYQGRGVGLGGLDEAVARADVVVSCTGSNGLVLTAAQLAAARSAAGGAPLVVLDLALPHDTDPAIDDLPGVSRIDLAQISGLPGAQAPHDAVLAARRVVATEVAAFAAVQAAHRVEPIVVSLRSRAAEVVEGELQRLRLRAPALDAATLAEVERSMRRAVSTLLHTPTVRMKQFAADPDGARYAEALHALFDLDPESVLRVVTPEDPTAPEALA